ncbi:MAG: hypothetical protein FWF35_02920 [Elusimicrobia bacterium]|nr:hypothetical protein [Elusimicrobiota bacterium]
MKSFTNDKWFKIICLGTAVIGMVKMVLYIKDGFIADELFTIYVTDPSQPMLYLLKKYWILDTSPPLHYFFVYLWNHLTPHITEISARIPSAAAGFAVVAVSFFCFPKYMPKYTRYIFTAIISCSSYAMVFACESRPYIFLLFLSVGIMFIMFELINKMESGVELKRKHFIWYFAVTLLLTYIHYWGSLLGGAVFLVLAFYSFKNKKYLKQFAIAYGVVLVLFLPWMIPSVYYNAMLERLSGNWWVSDDSLKSFLPGLLGSMFPRGIKVAAVGFGAALLIAEHFFSQKSVLKKYRREIYLSIFIIAFIFAGTAMAALKILLFVPRYFIVTAPFVLFIVSLALGATMENTKWIVIPVLLLFAFYIGNINSANKTMSEREAMLYVVEHNIPVLRTAVMEIFPLAAMEKIYAFYPNKYYGKNIEFINVYTHPDTPIGDTDLIWMPMCAPSKINFLENRLKMNLKKVKTVNSACFLEKDLDNPVFEPHEIKSKIDTVYSNNRKEHNPLGKLKLEE